MKNAFKSLWAVQGGQSAGKLISRRFSNALTDAFASLLHAYDGAICKRPGGLSPLFHSVRIPATLERTGRWNIHRSVRAKRKSALDAADRGAVLPVEVGNQPQKSVFLRPFSLFDTYCSFDRLLRPIPLVFYGDWHYNKAKNGCGRGFSAVLWRRRLKFSGSLRISLKPAEIPA